MKSNPDIRPFTVGNISVTAFCDFSEPQSVKGFFPQMTPKQRELLDRYYDWYHSDDMIPAWEYNSYLIKDGDRTILWDTGVGNSKITHLTYEPKWEGKLPCMLAEEGVALTDIDIILCSHFHPDHNGWNVIKTETGYSKTFPNAHYIGPKEDFDAYPTGIFGDSIPEESYQANMVFLSENGDMTWFEEPVMKITNHITVYHSPGHVPGLHYLIIESEGECAILTSDNFASPIHISAPDTVYLYDQEIENVIEGRRQILDICRDKKIHYLGAAHFGPGTLETDDDGTLFWVPLGI